MFHRYQIVESIRGSDYHVTDRAVDVQIVSLRKKLGSCAKYVDTVRGVGYRFLDVFSAHFRFNYSILPIRAHPSGQTYLLNKGHYNNVLNVALYYQLGKN